MANIVTAGVPFVSEKKPAKDANLFARTLSSQETPDAQEMPE
jgi:hypothetical protein